MHRRAERSRAFPVNDPHFVNSTTGAFLEVGWNQLPDVLRTKRMQVEFARDWNRHGDIAVRVHWQCSPFHEKSSRSLVTLLRGAGVGVAFGTGAAGGGVTVGDADSGSA